MWLNDGLKIRRLPERGRTGSIPVSGTILLFHSVSNRLITRLESRFAGFLLSYAIASGSMRYRHLDGIRDGTSENAKMRYCQRG